MLWTDSIFISTDDLMRIDSQVVAVAAAEGITLTGENGLIRAGIEECSMELQKYIVAFGGYLNSGDLTSNHVAAVLNVGIGNSVRQKATLDQVCVSGDTWSAFNWIKAWAIAWVLRIFYRSAYARTVDDRYEKKMALYKDEIIRRHTPNIYGLGVPIVLYPLYRPGSTFTVNAGTWGSSNVSLVAGAGTWNDQTVYVSITWVDQSQPSYYVSPTNTGNAESNGAEFVPQAVTTGNVIQVSIASLNPPTGVQPISQVLVTVVALLKATGWNVYAGLSPSEMYLQNATPLPMTQQTFTFPGNPLTSGYTLGLGQLPNRRLSVAMQRQRA
jgi:hypothetical protein